MSMAIRTVSPNCSWASRVPEPCGLEMVPCTVTVLSSAALVSAAWISATGVRSTAVPLPPPFAEPPPALFAPPLPPVPLEQPAARARARAPPAAMNPYLLNMCQNPPIGSGHAPRHPFRSPRYPASHGPVLPGCTDLALKQRQRPATAGVAGR